MGFLYSQLFITPPLPTRPVPSETIIVTGANTGLGLEAARHIARLHPANLILACRNTAAGETAKSSILSALPATSSTKIQVWPLDLSSYASITAFAHRCSQLDRLDALLASAGISTATFTLKEGHESSVTVNVLGTFLLCLLLIPKLEATAKLPSQDSVALPPRITIVSSEVHKQTAFTQQTASNIFAALSPKDEMEQKAAMADRYPLSKLLQILPARYGLAPALTKQASPVLVTYLNPGLCASELNREGNLIVRIMKALLGRTSEVGGRTIVAGVGGCVAEGEAGATEFGKWHGKYMSDGTENDADLGDFVKSEEGRKVGEKLWAEMLDILGKADGVEEQELKRWKA